MKTHQDMGTPLHTAGNELVGAEGTVPHEQVVGFEGLSEFNGRINFVGAHRTGLDLFPSSVAEVEQADHSEVREAAAFLLAGGLPVGPLVVFCGH